MFIILSDDTSLYELMWLWKTSVIIVQGLLLLLFHIVTAVSAELVYLDSKKLLMFYLNKFCCAFLIVNSSLPYLFSLPVLLYADFASSVRLINVLQYRPFLCLTCCRTYYISPSRRDASFSSCFFPWFKKMVLKQFVRLFRVPGTLFLLRWDQAYGKASFTFFSPHKGNLCCFFASLGFQAGADNCHSVYATLLLFHWEMLAVQL